MAARRPDAVRASVTNASLRRLAGLVAAIAFGTATDAYATPATRLSLPAGSLAAAVTELSQQAQVSISVADAGLWQQQVPAVSGRMDVNEALRKLVRGRGRIIPLGGDSWRIERRPQPIVPVPKPASVAVEAVRPPPDAPIVVTASKRDTRLSAYQGGVSVIEGTDIAFGGERGTDAILSRLATVSSTHLGAGRNKLFIRGLADSSFTGPTQATVGQYFGDVRLTYNAPDPDLRLYDIRSVEVLEGPQSTLYGAGALGGIIRITRNTPQLGSIGGAASAGLALTAHGEPGGDAGGMLNLPIVADRAALRLVGYAASDGGYIDNPSLGRRDVNRTRTLGGRAALRLVVGDDWTIDIDGTLQHIDGDDSQYADRDGPPLTQSGRFPQGFAARYALADVVVSGKWDDLRFQSSSGIAGQQLNERFDASASGGPDRLFTAANHTLLASNETRLWRPMRDGFGWVVGSSLLYNRTSLNRALGPVAAPVPIAGVTNSITEVTVFGEASITPTRWLTITGGGRFSFAWLSGGAEDVAPEVLLARAEITAGRTESRALPSLAVSVTPVSGVILYARYQQGFRPGGLAVTEDFVRQFRSDQVGSSELGLRYGDPGSGAFDASIGLVATRWRDIQADFIDASGLPTTDNIGNGRIHSATLRAGWRPVAGLAFDVGYAYNDGRVTEPAPRFVAAFVADRTAQIPNVAHHVARASLDYRAALSSTIDLRLGGVVQYFGRSRVGIGPVLGAEQGDYLDSSLTLRIGRPALGVTLGVTNLAGAVGNRFALGAPIGAGVGAQITPLRPRTVRIGLDARF